MDVSGAGWIEVWRASGPELVALGDRDLYIGTDEGNDIVVADDRTVSRLHCVLVRAGSHWMVRDVGSTNGTAVNGRRISNDRVLTSGDELQLGRTRLVFRARADVHGNPTDTVAAAPRVTPREHDVLVELCRPLLGGDVFTEPAPVHQIALALAVSDDAVKKHLSRLYDKFGIIDGIERRRMRLANDALARGAVLVSDLRSS